MRRGDLVTVATQGNLGKPRPALVIQSDQFDATATVTVLLVSSTLIDAPLIRLTVEPTPENGLRTSSQVMMDKAMTCVGKNSALRSAGSTMTPWLPFTVGWRYFSGLPNRKAQAVAKVASVVPQLVQLAL